MPGSSLPTSPKLGGGSPLPEFVEGGLDPVRKVYLNPKSVKGLNMGGGSQLSSPKQSGGDDLFFPSVSDLAEEASW